MEKTMKALVKKAKGPGNLALMDWPVPEIGDGDLLIQVKAAGICGSDLRMKNLGNSENLCAPVVVGHEFAGVIAAVGKNVNGFQVGQRVASDNSGDLCGHCDMCAQGNYLLCANRVGLGSGMDGGFAPYVKISQHLLSVNPQSLYLIPDNVSFEEASLLDPICNAYKAVVQESSLKPGQDIAIFGLGTIGLLAVKIAALMGAGRIIAVNRSDNQRRFQIAREFGATDVICSSREDVIRRVTQITGGEMVPTLIDCAGQNQILEQALTLLQKGGEFIKVGYDAGPVNVSLDHYVNKGIRIQGHFAYDYQGWKNCLKLLAMGKLDVRSIITHRLPLEQWEEGFRLVEHREGIKVIFEL